MDHRPHSVKTFAAHHPLLFALIFFAVSFCLNSAMILLGQQVVAIIFVGIIAVTMQVLLALGVLVWLGWLRKAGFNGPSQWRSLHLLWLPALLALLYIGSAFVTPVASTGVIALATTFSLLTALGEEGCYRGVILQALSPYRPFAGAALSSLLFALAHLNNLLTHLPAPIILGQVIGGFLLGFGFAACRLRTQTIWPLIIFHALYDLPANITLFDIRNTTSVYSVLANTSPGTIALGLVAPGFILACYGVFLLRPRRPQLQAPRQQEISSS
ncbi:MAG: CPBP family intramembrane glutamic endopeptidase [Ktedonobacteraceae bacterium]